MNVIMVSVVYIFFVFITSFTILTANYINSTSARFQQFQKTFYETSRGGYHEEHQSEESVHHSRQNLTAIRLANQHFLLIRTQHRCRVPRPKLIRVKDIYYSPSKEYLPRCTVLYQCDDESGCCEDEKERCVPQSSQTVELYFYAIHAEIRDSNSGGNGGRTEVLTFVNHTKCHCQEINYMPRNQPMPEQRHRPIYEYKSTSISETTTQMPITSLQTESVSLTLNCKCPQPFIARIRHSDERCICDCLERDYNCIRIKRGRHKLSPTDARCVRGGECSEPLCDFGGTYDRHDATCLIPRNKFRTHTRHHHHKNQHQNHWLHERD